jgi:hypothetical protein
MRHRMNMARTVRMSVEFPQAAADFDSAIPRFEYWRPSQYFQSLTVKQSFHSDFVQMLVRYQGQSGRTANAAVNPSRRFRL